MNLSAILRRLDLYEKLLRLDKPIGILLLLWPTLWALWLSANGRPDWKIVWIFTLGTVLMRSAGVAVNDFADRNFDPHVARTRDRPLAAGLVSQEALILAGLLAVLAFILILPLGKLVILLSFCALFLAVTYPFTKRSFALPRRTGHSLHSASPWPTRLRQTACPPPLGYCCLRTSSGPWCTTPSTPW
jgi:4-hydroxybenzoate polyprenyltransferase